MQGHPWLHGEFRSSLRYKKPFSKIKISISRQLFKMGKENLGFSPNIFSQNDVLALGFGPVRFEEKHKTSQQGKFP